MRSLRGSKWKEARTKSRISRKDEMHCSSLPTSFQNGWYTQITNKGALVKRIGKNSVTQKLRDGVSETFKILSEFVILSTLTNQLMYK